jgi:hypothetical protein
MITRSNKQVSAWLQIYTMLAPLKHTLGPPLSTTLSPMAHVKLIEHPPKMGRADLVLLGMSPHLTTR